MGDSISRVFVHLVWATWDRFPLLTPVIRPHIYRCFQAECARLRVDPVAIGGMDDHVHLLVRLPAALSVAALVKQLKGASSHLANHEVPKPVGFRWQAGYGAFSVSERLLPRVRDYVLNQEEHHRLGKLHSAYEPPDPREHP